MGRRRPEMGEPQRLFMALGEEEEVWLGGKVGVVVLPR
jgi:hypothetical protein